MQCTKPITLFKVGKKFYPLGLEVPCGKCMKCRKKQRSEWAMRLYHELSYHENSVFLTLTYNDKSLPKNDSLLKRDLQLFFKRLRKALPSEKKIKYFACGEYGDEKERPHYHAIVFGLGLKPEDRQYVIDSWNKCDWDVKEIYNNSFGYVSPQSINYTAGYVNKKWSGRMAEEEYEQRGREPVFRISSLGLGKRFALDESKRITEDLEINYQGRKVSIPRYYIKVLGIDPDLIKDKALDINREKVNKLVGLYLDSNELYCYGDLNDNLCYIEKNNSTKAQADLNLQAKLNLTKRKF